MFSGVNGPRAGLGPVCFPSLGSNIWLLLRHKIKFQRATSYFLVSLGTRSCPQKEATVSYLEGEACDHTFPFQVHRRYCILELAQKASNWHRSIWDWLPIKPIYSSLLLTAATQEPFLQFNPCSFTSDLLIWPAHLWVSRSSGCKPGVLLTRWASSPFLSAC